MPENPGTEKKPREIIFEYLKSPDYKQIYVTGARGGIRPYDFRLDFYNEEPERDETIKTHDGKVIKDDVPTEIIVKREYKVGLILSMRSLIEMAGFFNDQIKLLKKEGMLEEV